MFKLSLYGGKNIDLCAIFPVYWRQTQNGQKREKVSCGTRQRSKSHGINPVCRVHYDPIMQGSVMCLLSILNQ